MDVVGACCAFEQRELNFVTQMSNTNPLSSRECIPVPLSNMEGSATLQGGHQVPGNAPVLGKSLI